MVILLAGREFLKQDDLAPPQPICRGVKLAFCGRSCGWREFAWNEVWDR